MMAESAAAVAYGGGLMVGMTQGQRTKMADSLRAAGGPGEILKVVYEMEMDPAKGLSAMNQQGKMSWINFIERCWAKVGGQTRSKADGRKITAELLREATRKAYIACVRQLRHHVLIIVFGSFLTDCSSTPPHTRHMPCTTLSDHAHWVLIGACNSMLCPIHVFRQWTPSSPGGWCHARRLMYSPFATWVISSGACGHWPMTGRGPRTDSER